MRKAWFSILLFSLSTPLLAKMYEPPRSFSLQDKTMERVDLKRVPAIDVKKLLAEDNRRAKTRPAPHRFALPATVEYNLDNSGTWQDVPDGRLWRLRIQSDNAISMNLGITRFNMPEGAKLWIYDPQHKYVNGPYTNRERSHKGSLWTPIVLGDEIIVEVFVPSGAKTPAIEIQRVNRGYRGFAKGSMPGDSAEEACEIDVVCPQGTPWADQIRSVGVYTLNGFNDCSGAMVNNTSYDFTPYFLSANHCTVSAANDDTVVVYWNFQSPTCGTHDAGPLTDTQSGSTYRASWAGSDFLLFQLDTMPDPSYHVFYAGWDRTGVAPPSTVCIHHPACDVKAISFSDSAPTIHAYPFPGGTADVSHWQVFWDSGTSTAEGVTEHGSSGSPLFETTNHRIIGQLHGGLSDCAATSPDINDYFGMFSWSWDGGGASNSRLRDWLDPTSTGVSTMDGDPHITTFNNVPFDFQGGGEYVAFRDADGSELQIRSTPISTSWFPGPNAYTGIASCVSLNTAAAAKVNDHRVSIEPNLSGVPDPSGLQVRVDGHVTAVGPGGVTLGPGGRIVEPASGSYVIDFPNGTIATVISNYWSSEGKWYLNVDATRGPAWSSGGGSPGAVKHPGGIMAAIPQGSWLSPMSDGTKFGSRPAALTARYDDLYHRFGDSWRVTNADSLFDYAPGQSTDTFTYKDWPRDSAPCVVPDMKPVEPLPLEKAQALCANVTNRFSKQNCIFDVRATGEPGFAKLYLKTQRFRSQRTSVRLTDLKNPTRPEEVVRLVATVTQMGKPLEKGVIQFMIDGNAAGKPVKLNARGQASYMTRTLREGEHAITAVYKPLLGATRISNSSTETIHIVK